MPAEAIKLRANILHEYAAEFEIRDPERAAAYLKEEIKLLQNGLLTMDALERKWQLARLLLYFKPEQAKQLLEEVGSKLETLQEQPSLKYPYIEMSLSYALLSMPKESITAYEKANSISLSLEHYTPRIRLDYLASAYCIRFFGLLKGIQQLKHKPDLLKTSEGQKWINDFPYVSNFSAAILCGSYLGYGDSMLIAKRRYSLSDCSDQLYESSWFFIPEIEIAFDPTIRNTTTGITGGAFLAQKHPLVAPFQETNANRKLILQPIETLNGNKTMFSGTNTTVIDHILQALNAISDTDSPSIETLHELYQTYIVMQPIPD